MNFSGCGYATGSCDMALRQHLSTVPGAQQETGKHLPRIRNDNRACGDPKPLVLVLVHSAMRDRGRSDAVPPHDFLHKRPHVRERVSVHEVGKSVGTDDRVELALCLLLCFWKLDHCKEECVHGVQRLRCCMLEGAGQAAGTRFHLPCPPQLTTDVRG